MLTRPSALRFALLIAVALALGCAAHEPRNEPSGAPGAPFVVEAACGECQFGMPGASCDLAVRIDGQAYFVQGTGIDEHGDAHADDGFCKAIRSARVTGHVEGAVFVADSFELVSAER